MLFTVLECVAVCSITCSIIYLQSKPGQGSWEDSLWGVVVILSSKMRNYKLINTYYIYGIYSVLICKILFWYLELTMYTGKESG